ncbi:precorrin-2/cobalt-factor-2 C20-methyltransferase [Candidatus Hakubella thermalkaliphila]|uniref:Precorrin-2/cobalt-factor-2 C20-methyltransferase n=1 Tax=Candidatus Hakubella thermalkaliphila TaxID=2754717 RepID=A0A6V8PS64_9ACTN|nr:precorrin-2 C(20)-methyltransferase [Candidatus Hakubella thermalkaliphila]GFP34654.1 precorrin-2/cobalt-factor-2 C20-methyltransferase [Candidatus Hakubella thermalkaliphila]
MRDDNRRGPGTIGKFYGVGLGPGDPKLLTLKAKEILEKVDVIFVPKADREGNSRARSIVEAATAGPWNFVELIFPMAKDEKILGSYWKKAAGRIAEEVWIGKTVAFVTIGDPFIYSTYIYVLKTLRQNFPDIEVETIPGISAFNAAASLAQIPLVEGEERLAILPVTDDLRPLRETFKEFDTVVLMKVGSKLERVVRLLNELNLIKNAVLISHAGCPNEYIERDLSILSGKELGYLSVIIVKCRQEEKA